METIFETGTSFESMMPPEIFWRQFDGGSGGTPGGNPGESPGDATGDAAAGNPAGRSIRSFDRSSGGKETN